MAGEYTIVGGLAIVALDTHGLVTPRSTVSGRGVLATFVLAIRSKQKSTRTLELAPEFEDWQHDRPAIVLLPLLTIAGAFPPGATATELDETQQPADPSARCRSAAGAAACAAQL